MAELKKPLPSRWECANCSLPEQPGVALRPCSRCKLVRYCGTECQAQHWKKGGHTQNCVAPDQRKPQPLPKEKAGAEGSSCAICLETMSNANTTQLSCSHVFHRHCALGLQSRVCPVCRNYISQDSFNQFVSSNAPNEVLYYKYLSHLNLTRPVLNLGVS